MRAPERALAAGTLAVCTLVAVGLAAGCGSGCRVIDVVEQPLLCDANATFVGENHFDDAATYESFLSGECLPNNTPADLDSRVSAVDFSVNAVFVAVGAKNLGTSRCITTRALDRVEACTDGMRVSFLDDLVEDAVCPGTWTVAFALSRADLRAALPDEPTGQTF